MVDSATDASIAQVQSSYSDVNNALENLLGNMSSGSSYDAKAAIANLQNQLNNFIGTNPVGTVLAFTTNTIPNGYLLCNGASFDTSKYSQLYSALGASSVPDMRGMFLRGLDTAGTIDNYSGRALLSFEEGSRLIANDSTVAGAASLQYVGNATNALKQSFGWDNQQNPNEALNTGTEYGNNLPISSWDSYKNGFSPVGIARPKNVAVNYIIKAVP